VSNRHLQRLFAERVGIGPARYAQLARFARAVPLVSSARTLTDVAAGAGYFDQAHFCRDFRAFSGMTPDEYRRAGAQVPGHIFAI
jgi:transcriptional regulator GlxA family with amidase domain